MFEHRFTTFDLSDKLVRILQEIKKPEPDMEKIEAYTTDCLKISVNLAQASLESYRELLENFGKPI